MQPGDLALLTTPGDPRWHPDGQRIAYTVTTVDIDDDRYPTAIHIHDGTSSRRVTSGDGDRAPRWSPDGAALAFTRTVDERPQLAVLPVDGGEARVLTSMPLGVFGEPVWMPDSRHVVVVGVEWSGGWEDLEDDERARAPRRITRWPYRGDGVGDLHHRRRDLWLIDTHEATEPRRLVGEDAWPERRPDVLTGPAVAPDGRTVAFLTDTADQPALASGSEVWAVDVADGSVSRLVERGFWNLISYRPDGVLHLMGDPRPLYPVDMTLWRLDDAGPTSLTRHVGRGSSSAFTAPRIVWEGDTAVVGLEDGGGSGVIAVAPDGSTTTRLDGPRSATAFDSAAGRLAVILTDAATLPDLHLVTADGEEPLTTYGADAGIEIAPVTHHQVTVGDHVVDAWVTLPPGNEQAPVLLNIHGGPASQYGFYFFDEFQVYAAAGYGVVACNPRGSSGRGEEFVRAVVGDGWGVVDVEDVNAVLEHVIQATDRLDGDRIGIMGGSYGGFLTAWMTGSEPERWRSAVVERGLLDWTSFAGTSDIGLMFPGHYAATDDHAVLWDKSPLRLAPQTITPTLVLHADSDWRCPLGQAEQYAAALLTAGCPVELLVFPGEGHEMSRSGKPRHRIERFEAILDWHARHLD